MLGPRPVPETVVREATQKGLEALDLLEHPAFRRACSELQARALKAFRLSDPNDHQGREGAYYMLRALDALASELTSSVAGAEITKHNFRHVMRGGENDE
jgi:hypothetical protein